MRLKTTQAGDTIVEVLVAMAVVSAVLGGAFVLANKSTQNARQAQEHGEALKLVESQLEQLRNLANQSNSPLFDTNRPVSFCIVNQAIVASTMPECAQGDENRYKLTITSNNPTPTTDGYLFDAQANWDGLGGLPQNVGLLYKLYK